MRQRGIVSYSGSVSISIVLLAVGCKSTPDADDCRDAKCGISSLAVTQRVAASAPQSIPPAAYAVSARVIDLPPIDSKPEEGFDEESKIGPPRAFRNEDFSAEPSRDTVVQNFEIEASLPDPEVSFDGLTNTNNAASFGFRVSPPDTNGDVGPNHYVQMANLLVRVFNKAGAPLTPPFRLSSLFAPLGGQCAADDAGDPVVLYDPLSDRWVLSQFAFLTTAAPPYHECFAISQTPDPTGAYFLFDFVTPGANFPDYPKLGVWPDGYYMTTNQFLNGATFNGAGVFAFERARMVAGDPTAAARSRTTARDASISALTRAAAGPCGNTAT